MLLTLASLTILLTLAGAVAFGRRGALLAVVVSATAGAATFLQRPSQAKTYAALPIQSDDYGYVGSNACRSCHPGEHASWAHSYHSRMTQVADTSTVLGDFDDVRLDAQGRRVRLFEEDDAYWIEEGPIESTPSFRARIVMTTGSHHEQVYWYETEGNHQLGHVPYIWSLPEQQWIPFDAAFVQPPHNGMRPLFRGQWTRSCIRCHATHGVPHEASKERPEVADLGIRCEACHGPGREHVAAQQSPLRRYGEHLGLTDSPSGSTNPADLDHRRSTEVCGQCHSVHLELDHAALAQWDDVGSNYRPGDVLADSLHVARRGQDEDVPTLRSALKQQAVQGIDWWDQYFWPDGMIRVSGREYNGLLESPCFQHGEMSCLSCHDLHRDGGAHPESVSEWADDQLAADMDGDQGCAQCHPRFADEPSRAEHTHHAASANVNCYDCHMPHTTYGLLKAIRSHQVDSPSVASTLEAGRPNACNLCHLDESLGWTQQHLADWYGHDTHELDAEQQSTSAAVGWVLTGDAGQRAIAAWHFGQDFAQRASGADWMAPVLAPLLQDPYDAVRIVAQRALHTLPGFAEVDTKPLGTPREQREAREGLVAKWQRSANLDARPERPTLPFLRDGALDLAWIERMLTLRDDRPVRLAE